MNIALIVEHADARRGGAERYTQQLAAALAERGHQVTLLANRGSDAPAGAKLVALQTAGIGRTARYHRFLQSLNQHLTEHPYDIVHAMCPVHQCDIYHP
ncbi:MAG TPA: glycosyltransferase family 4 protein, partial [Tepidisphaeraceae bacterium]|nr:glycosyltransferase family 4 protein [Tepidisphaeraceae bacterium]